jgi:hypothetical protein
MRKPGRHAFSCEPCAPWRAALAAALLVVATGCTSTPTYEDDDGVAAASTRPVPVKAQDLPDLPARHQLLKGTYAVPFSGWREIPPEVADLRAVVTFPEGFQIDDGSTMIETGSGLLSDRRRLGFWTVEKVATNFCAGGGPDDFTDPGATVADLATALAGQPRLRGTHPVHVAIGEYEGLYVELTRPAVWCQGSVLWFAPRVGHTAYLDRFIGRDIARFWILDVGGHRVVINTIHPADASDEEVAELTRIVESATLTERQTP